MRIAELPFHERPLLELLHLDVHRDVPDHDYAGYGWTRAERLWLATEDTAHEVEDALVLALHTADDAEVLADDLELELEVPGAAPVAVLASRFLEVWLPKLPRDPSAIVLAVCNPHRARLHAVAATAPIHYADGDVYSWIDRDTGRVELTADRWQLM